MTVGNRRPPEKFQKSHLFFKSDNFWKMPRQNTVKGVKKLSTAEKVRIMAWREEGVLTSAIADRLGRHRSSVKRLLAKMKALPKNVIPERKKGLAILPR